MSTREMILNTMYNLIAEKGYDGSSIGQICDIVGISKPSVYYYFKSKEEIFIELFQKTIEKNNEIFNIQKLDDIDTAEAYRDYLIDEYTMFLKSYLKDKQSHLANIEFAIQSNRIPVIHTMQNKLIKKIMSEIKDILKRGQEIGAFPPLFDIDKNTEYIYTILQGCDCSIMYNMPVDTASVWEMTVDSLFKS